MSQDNSVVANKNLPGQDESSAAEIDADNPTSPALDRQPSRMESFFALTKTLIVRALIVYFITSFFRRPAAPVTDSKGGTAAQVTAFNMFPNGTYLDMICYLTEKDHIDFSENLTPLWIKKDIVYGDWSSGSNEDGSYSFATTFKTSESLKNNGSIYLHVFITKSGKSPDPNSGDLYAGQYYTYTKKMLNRYKKLKYMKTHNLLTGATERSAEEIVKAEKMKEEIISHWHPNVTISIVTDQTNWVLGSVPPPLNEFIYFLPDAKQYKAPIYINDYWNKLKDYTPINTTVDELSLLLTVTPLSLFKWQLYVSQSMGNKFGWVATLNDDEQDDDQDALKELLLETSPYLLALTVIVSLLHSVFELLAFKNDIQFWNNRKSLEGLSVRSVFFNVFQSLIVLLYVLDNEANTMVRISCFIGLIIEIWKINKAVDISIKMNGWLPKISFTDKGSYVESSTRQYDILAFKYLSWACFPLLIAYGIYSLIYNEHKGWYSFVLNMLYGYLLTFGFIMMTPQLFINYKLKSVAHLPWRMMSYKFLNTFIDDIFAFVIKMPTMYRLGCFRDDIVFIIFLYQRWIYKVDITRVNEFGFSGEMEDEVKRKQITSGKDQSDKKND